MSDARAVTVESMLKNRESLVMVCGMAFQTINNASGNGKPITVPTNNTPAPTDNRGVTGLVTAKGTGFQAPQITHNKT